MHVHPSIRPNTALLSTLLRVEDWRLALLEYPSLLDDPAVKAHFDLLVCWCITRCMHVGAWGGMRTDACRHAQCAAHGKTTPSSLCCHVSVRHAPLFTQHHLHTHVTSPPAPPSSPPSMPQTSVPPWHRGRRGRLARPKPSLRSKRDYMCACICVEGWGGVCVGW